ncbi:DinB family protein [Aeromicrobium sp. Leaf350]|uniref:DinB family protein n=1 Tax=Aeromicrobium sp. Leaf350 TaxID=2876565 RepID=UPI001E31E332|nr:DinB family protein [Aeromicrobium sp. Leaf350]
MTEDAKAHLTLYLTQVREALLWKLEGLDDYDVRRPLTPTGTNLLGLVKHVAACAADYFGLVFDRPFPGDLPLSDDDPLIDLWCPAEETRADVLDLWHRAWAHADATIAELPLDAPGRVPWWGDRGEVTLHRILVHMNVELARHTGQVDILREGLDGFTGMRADVDNMPDDVDWPAHVERVEQAARLSRST